MSSEKQRKTQYYLLTAMVFYLLLGVFSSSVPFFWDMLNFSRMAQYYLSQNFNHIIVPEHLDDGHPPLFSLYLAFCWKIFGKSLIVFHLSMLGFIIGVVREYYRLATKWIHSGAIPIALILLIVEPSYLSQCIMGAQDIIIVYFVLLSINSITEDKKITYSISLLILSFLNIRGFLFIIPLGIYHLFTVNKYILNKFIFSQIKNKRKEMLPYIPALFAFFCWGVYHYQIRGWALFPPTRMAHRGIAEPIQIFRNGLYICWKMIDFGRIITFGIVVFSLVNKKLRKTIPNPFLVLILIFISFFYLIMAPLTNPIGHRYFIIVYLFISIAVAEILYSLNSLQMRIGLIITLISLVFGNFILYPEKYGNGWDSSIKFIPYFKVKDQMNAFIESHHIETKKTASGFPLRADPAYSNLNDSYYYIQDKDSLPFNSFDYILQSNICNTFSEKQIQELHSLNYEELASYKSGQVYIKLFKNLKLGEKNHLIKNQD